ncbi:MAG: UDP-N-acetylmuramoylalanyl-D-glutamyl-2,6-diaminopimelate--D-alanyl-D-alanyl ligase, UDP-N-acetylmuramoyl-tripeptide--D-alanyl-D-alanine ligase [candidate division Kazan bacterium GW2011_GWA1_50_15]|uniref:UDP-N-acetylmuramoyl-tripeptide-D-alanyl-D-alanine ligase n=2 Tax=Bacteria division Kazan-3B-28 TaxID=1798534 RepID=A0A0G1X7R9_UNCK3|nr:MAG: UDP-N-acetylmuramoylalanyl-D-glutamyl-2,6-diaminopimelate--D-alanyl-D-alanyl ligase, UDP-N-acetylmuramoyl-tripeptide--D-alanyl-D-alanine ligase [candidate division Kazan bacterium GW2011_GWA1_50_15]KKW25570.1 MAG: UDP-N-acetylmuramoyl-tripeptide-D-alanyl-D-alanine ligase [candidate division Kazan bacterium GW2011_GWC1_52_13]KKW26875.1 MAG: UDP-N-acetylmuramoyl-tripeptide-D-alanyl-D-alanine ligase [candidate division Kazan bacterium GW2011_GWB1_52_7]
MFSPHRWSAKAGPRSTRASHLLPTPPQEEIEETLVWGRVFAYYGRVKKIALNLLVSLSRRILAKYQPRIIGVTGSVGKTTTKEAIYTALRGSFRVARSLKDANTEWGVTATIIDQEFYPVGRDSIGRAKLSVGELIGLLYRGCKRLLVKGDYPEILILELAAEQAGDIKFFNQFLQYDIAVITNIGQVHLEFYRDQTELTAEKLSIADGLKPSGLMVLNGDNELLTEFITTTRLRRTTFGWDEANQYNIHLRDIGVDGLRYEVNTPDGGVEVVLGFGRQLVDAAAVAVAVGRELGIPLAQLGQRLTGLASPAGRFEMWQLRRGITLVNDAYNANPDSMKSALTSLQDIASVSPPGATRRRVAILGGMRELGLAHETAHLDVGRFLRDKVDLLVAVGADGGLMADAAGLSADQVVQVDDPSQVDFSKFLQDNDAVLVKASRSFGLDVVAQAIRQRIGQ